MARSYSATTDVLVPSYTTQPTTLTISCWTYRTGEGGGNAGRIVDKFDGSTEAIIMMNVLSSTAYRFYAEFSTTAGRWQVAQPSTNTWHNFLVTYDGSSTANDPLMYIDGVSQSVTENQTPVGTYSTNSGAWRIGNRSGDSRQWGGSLAEFAVWNRQLTAGEAEAVGKGYSPAYFQNGLVFYTDLIRDVFDRKGTGSITVTGTAVDTHPRIIYPRRTFYSMGALSTLTGTVSASDSGGVTAALAGSPKVPGTAAVADTASNTAALAGSPVAAGVSAATDAAGVVASLSGTTTITGAASVADSGADTAALTDQSQTGTIACLDSGTDACLIIYDVRTGGGTGGKRKRRTRAMTTQERYQSAIDATKARELRAFARLQMDNESIISVLLDD